MNINKSDEIIFNVKSKNPTTEPSERHSFRTKSGSADITFVRKKRMFGPEKLKELQKVYSSVVVNDYGDEYHMSEEEKKKRFIYYEAFSKIIRRKKKYRKLDEYVKSFRLCIDCLRVVANDNGIYDPDKFMRMVLKGELEVYGLSFPKYIGKDKKDINWDYISEFIMDYSRDPQELSPDKEDDILEDMDEEDLEELLFDEDDLQKIMDSIENPNDDEILRSVDETDEDIIEKEGYSVISDKKETRELIKSNPQLLKRIRDNIRETRKRNATHSKLNSFVFDMTEDDFEYIENLDRSRGFDTEYRFPEFKGDIMNRKDYKRYLLAVENYENENIKINYQGKMRSKSEIDEIELKDVLEKSGWNVRNLYKQKDKDKKRQKAYIREKRRVEKLKKELLSSQNLKKKIKGKLDIEFDAKKGKKKGKKSKKKKESE